MPHGTYARFTHMLQDHKVNKTDRVVFVKLQTLLVDALAKNHFKLFMGNFERVQVINYNSAYFIDFRYGSTYQRSV